MKSSSLEQVREGLGIPVRKPLYTGLYADVQGSPPSDNTSSDGRRARAAFAKNAAFVVLFDRQPAGAGLAPLATIQRAALIATTRALLESSNTNVEVFATWTRTTLYTEWQWRSKELIDYLIAYDLLRGAGETPASLAAS